MAMSAGIAPTAFTTPAVATATSSRSQQGFQNSKQQQWEQHHRLQPSPDSLSGVGAHMHVFMVGVAVALGSTMRHRTRKQKLSTVRLAAAKKGVATLPVAVKVASKVPKVVATVPVAEKVASEAAKVETTVPVAGKVASKVPRKLKPALRDPDKPRIPLPALFRFLHEYRKGPKAKGTYRETLVSGVSAWKKLSVAERGRFQKPFDAEWKAYTKKREAYIKSGKRDAWKRDPARPKKALCSWLRFYKDKLETVSKLPTIEGVKKLSAKWKELASSKKKPYEQAWEKDAKIYHSAMKDYKSSGKEAEWLAKVGITALREKAEAKQVKLAASLKIKARKAVVKLGNALADASKMASIKVKEKTQPANKLVAEKLKAAKTKHVAAEKERKESQKTKLVAVATKEKELTKKKEAKTVAAAKPVKEKAVKAKGSDTATNKIVDASTQKEMAAKAKGKKALDAKVVTAKLKAETAKVVKTKLKVAKAVKA